MTTATLSPSLLSQEERSPLYAAICEAAEARAERNVALIQDYVRRLQQMDWEHEFSDDFGVYSRGRDELRSLRAMQRQIDRDLSIWNSIAPSGHRVRVD